MIYSRNLACHPLSSVLTCRCAVNVTGKWQTQKAPLIGQDYWQLGPDGTMRDLILASEYPSALLLHDSCMLA